MMKAYTTIFPAAFLLFLGVGNVFSQQETIPPYLFQQNKGQWEHNILYKADIKSGAVFLEETGITFNLYSSDDIWRIKGSHHRLENYPPKIDYTLHYHAFKISFAGASGAGSVQAEQPVKEYFNYFLGNDKTKWAADVRAFQRIVYQQIYPGVDFAIASEDGHLKYAYHIRPGATPDPIVNRFDGVENLALSETGDLLIQTSLGTIRDLKPIAYQIVAGKKINVACRYRLSDNQLHYVFPKGYDSRYELVIDPTLIFSTYSGSYADNFGYSATYDHQGNAFAAGTVFGVGYPVTLGAYQVNYLGGPVITFTGGGQYPGDDIGITKYSADGTQRLYSTYLGGYGTDLPHSMIVNNKDELYLLGTTGAADFPVSADAYDKTFNGGNDPGVFDGIAAHFKNGSDIFIARFSADGTQLLSSTYVGGSDNDGLNYRAGQPYSAPGFLRHNYADEVRGEIDIDNNNNVYVASCTRSADFPRTSGTFQSAFGGESDACVFKMDATLSTMIWSTTFGGSDDDAAYSVAIDHDENIYVAGGTRSINFPTTAGTVQSTFAGGEADGFLIHLDKNGQQNLAATYYGYEEYDQIYFVELDGEGQVYVLGQADNSGSKYIKNALYNKPNGGQFISKITPQLDSIIWSTSFGRGMGVTDISPTAFLVDVCNSVYACGWGSQGVNNIVGGAGGTLGLDVTPNAFKTTTDGQDFYLLVLKDDASQLTYATFIGGPVSEEHVDGGTSRFDKRGIVYQSVCAGCGGHSDFPTTAGAVSATNNAGNCNNAVFKFDLDLPICLADFDFPNACKNVPVQFQNKSSSQQTPSYQWTFGDGQSSTQANPAHTYSQTGLFEVRLVITDPGSCNFSDTISKKILVIGNNGADTLPDLTICNTQSVQIGIPPSNADSVSYQWTPTNSLSAGNVPNPLAFPTQTTTYTLLVANGICTDTLRQRVLVRTDTLSIQGADVLCAGDTVQLNVNAGYEDPTFTYHWAPDSAIILGGNTASPWVSPTGNTTYTVSVSNSAGCTLSGSILIHVSSSLPSVQATALPDTILFGDTTQLQLHLSPSVTHYQWAADSTLSATDVVNPYAFPLHTHTYFVEVSDSQGCLKRNAVTVVVKQKPCEEANIYIPNAFSPNGDGKNDVLYVRGNNITELYFAIYDRWGQRVFETNDVHLGWDGTFNGSRLDPAVFGYYAEGLCPNGEKFFKKGNITLLR